MNILYIAPLPPPVTGHSLVSQVLLNHLKERHTVESIDLSKDSQHDGGFTFKRIRAVLSSVRAIRRVVKNSETVYLTISESIAGNLKDLLIYAVIGNLIENTVIHLHGGSFRREIIDRSRVLRFLNERFLRKVRRAIVSGPSHLGIFDGLISRERIAVVPNFSTDCMFVDFEAVSRKYGCVNVKLRVLYVSAMTEGKGYSRLLDAYEKLTAEGRDNIEVDFAGKFYNELEEIAFLKRISGQAGIRYHGVVSDPEKASLFAQAHLFCLPTSHFEGQPISILEAYASGCVVLTTERPGILDIFTPQRNGFIAPPCGSEQIRAVLENIWDDVPALAGIALHNRRQAQEMYREQVFCSRVEAEILARWSGR